MGISKTDQERAEQGHQAEAVGSSSSSSSSSVAAAPKSSSRKPSRRPGIVVEFIAIVFGVVLGHLLAEWREDAQRAELIARSLTAIDQEMRTNYDALNSSRSYHLRLLPFVTAAQRTQEESGTPQRIDYQGLGTPKIRTAAYQTAIGAGIFPEIDPSRATAITSAYFTTEQAYETRENYALALALLDPDQERFLALISTAFRDFLWAEDAALNELAPLIQEAPPTPWIEELPPGP